MLFHTLTPQNTWHLYSNIRVEICLSDAGYCGRTSPVVYGGERSANFTTGDFGSSGCNVVCPAGFYSSSSLGPQECPAGSFLTDAGTDALLHDSIDDCSVCRAGFYAETTGRTANCTACPSGYYLTDPGTDPTLHDSQDDCSPCPGQ